MIKFEVSYPGGTTHEVELPGSVAVLGRDPGCDVVLNDSKCSRRHAIVEEGPEGLVIRDSGSANGVYVNGRRVDQAAVKEGDVVRLGEVELRLVTQIGETVVMAPEDMELHTLAGAPASPDELPSPEALLVTPRIDQRPAPVRPPAADRRPPAEARPPAEPRSAAEARPPAERPLAQPRPSIEGRRAPEPRRATDTQPVDERREEAARGGRPATVNVLVALWALFVPASAAGCLLAAARLGGGTTGWTVGALAALVLAALGTAMAAGLRALAPWARHLQIAAAALGLLACPFTLASATVLLYLTRPEIRALFAGYPGRGAGDGAAEPTFALSLVGMLAVGVAITAIAVLLL